ncbi:MAG TPA: hypothetical protein VNH11_18905 [Pirellulales bacterium]|nr:hypothetical protein [Pirellulales bacterium]
MVFGSVRQATWCVVLAASFLWLAIQYRENHRDLRSGLSEPPDLLQENHRAVPLAPSNRAEVKLVAYEEEDERPRVRLAQVPAAATSTAPAAPSKADISSFTNLPAPPAPKITLGGNAPKTDPSGALLLNNLTFHAAGTDDKAAGVTGGASAIAVLFNGVDQADTLASPDAKSGAWATDVTVPIEGDYAISVVRVLLDANKKQVAVGKASPEVQVRIRTSGPHVTRAEPQNFAYTKSDSVTVHFDPDHPLDGTKLDKNNYVLKDSKAAPKDAVTPVLNPDNSVTLAYTNLSPDLYTLTVYTTKIVDVYGNTGQADYTTQLFKPVGGELPSVSPGIHSPTGPYIEFQEYLDPPPEPNGFNPGDHVETRVSRMYYFRDAHRVAQVINRTAQSYNRAAVDMERQLADRARYIADKATDDRQAKERTAVEAARQTREAEHALQHADATLRSTVNQLQQTQGQLNAAQNPAGAQAPAAPAGANAAGGAPATGQAAHPVNGTPPNPQVAQLQSTVNQLNSVADTARIRAQSGFDQVQRLRAVEAQANEEAQAANAVEDRAREEQFRREVAAANEDPDTYAPGKPQSKDYVRRVSLSVIGEGVIQLRGPIKGINEIRKMIHEIDAPVGQVNVAVHTVQVNGEHGDRMERVEERIQTYIDHARFLTLQSAEMLRKAAVKVAAIKAAECNDLVGLTQQDRDQKYLYSFFGADFIQELIALDSEFLHTGNKLLSLHSMDTTSLQSALFLMALAKNSTRLAILTEFEQMTAAALPMAEERYLEAGLSCDCPHKMICPHRHAFQLLAGNARFESLRGMFDSEIDVDDTMTPVQREFLKLAQILKSRLVVELEINQRVMERAVIEERLGNYVEQLKKAKLKDDAAQTALGRATTTAQTQRTKALEAISQLATELASVDEAVAQALQTPLPATGMTENVTRFAKDQLQKVTGAISPEAARQMEAAATEDAAELILAACSNRDDPNNSIPRRLLRLQERQLELAAQSLTDNGSRDLINDSLKAIRKLPGNRQQLRLFPDPTNNQWSITVTRDGTLTISQGLSEKYQRSLAANIQKVECLRRFLPSAQCCCAPGTLEQADQCFGRVKQMKSTEILDNLSAIEEIWHTYRHAGSEFSKRLSLQLDRLDEVARKLSDAVLLQNEGSIAALYESWKKVRGESAGCMDGAGFEQARTLLAAADKGFATLLVADLERQSKQEQALAARRPLDHRKFLDMLIDEMEDKFVELLEGTRAHTANIDAYIKRLVTSLNDDFNTQFYYPAFRQVRRASRMWDVTMGQIETTSILANNRSFAKVSPAATMEFDLPKRDIVIAEAMNGAKAAVSDFGALVNDPAFVSLAKLNSGQPTSTPAGGATGGLATVRDVLPGLSTDTAEQVMAQQGPGNQKLGSALESLIPDPAVYKFETGTGYEIRPVIQPDGQAVVFHLQYMYTTNVREPVRADEKHLGRVKRHFIDTDVQLSNYELREVSRYQVALKASRTSQGVPLLQDIPIAGVLFRPLPSAESSLQENIILGQATIFPTLFDLMGLRWAPAVADLDPLRLENDEFVVRNRRRAIMNRVYDFSSGQVDTFLRIPEAERRTDLYRSQETIESVHPNGYHGPGLNFRDSHLEEGYDPRSTPESRFVPGDDLDDTPYRRRGTPPVQGPSILSPSGTVLPHRGDGDGDRNSSAPERINTPEGEPQSQRRHSGKTAVVRKAPTAKRSAGGRASRQSAKGSEATLTEFLEDEHAADGSSRRAPARKSPPRIARDELTPHKAWSTGPSSRKRSPAVETAEHNAKKKRGLLNWTTRKKSTNRATEKR